MLSFQQKNKKMIMVMKVNKYESDPNPDLLREISSIHKSSFENGWNTEDFKKFIENKGHIITARNNNEIIGFVLFRIASDESEILTIAVLKEFRKQGVGSDLLKNTINYIKNNGVKNLFLEVREDDISAVNFYIKNGAKEVSRRKNYYVRNGKNVNAINMIIQLV